MNKSNRNKNLTFSSCTFLSSDKRWISIKVFILNNPFQYPLSFFFQPIIIFYKLMKQKVDTIHKATRRTIRLILTTLWLKMNAIYKSSDARPRVSSLLSGIFTKGDLNL